MQTGIAVAHNPPMRDCHYLFVYGSLRRACGGRLHRMLIRNASYVGPGSIRGRLFQVDGYPGAVPSIIDGEQVSGDILRLRRPAALLPRLDRYEGTGPRFRRPNAFRRARIAVTDETGRVIDAWVYLYDRPVRGLRRIPSGDYCGR